MNSARWQGIEQLIYGVGAIIAVVLMTAWKDIPGTTALVVILGITGTSGAHSLAASTAPASVAQTLAENAGDRGQDGRQ